MSAQPRWSALAALALLITACSSSPVLPGDGRPLPPPTLPSTAPPSGHTFYVDTKGHDDASGSRRKPWGTLGHALPLLRAGDLLYVRGGTYREQVIDVSVHAADPTRRIVVRAAPGERPVIRGLLWLRSPSYWTVDGINVTWDTQRNAPNQHLVKITNGLGWVWQNSELWGARSFADILITSDRPREPADWALVGNCIHDTVPTNGPSQDSNIYVGNIQSAGAGLIERNLVFGAQNGRNIKLGGARTAPDTGPANVTVRYNTLVDAVVPVVVAGGARNITITHNLLGEGHRGYLIRGFELSGSNVTVRDNIGYGAGRFFAPGSGTLVQGPGNVILDRAPVGGPRSCEGFKPVAPDALTAGRYARGQ